MRVRSLALVKHKSVNFGIKKNKVDSNHYLPLSLKEGTQYWFSLFPNHEIISYYAHFENVSLLSYQTVTKIGIVSDAEGFMNETESVLCYLLQW